jgi:RNA 3'-terminal phosphate cyclase (ATP)
MIVIDGSAGEGGGQVLRTALSLSLVTGQPFRIENIRANRSRPGLMRQHITAVEAACAVGGTECAELAVGASELSFTPGPVKPGDHHFSVGTAGSTSLVLQTVLPALMLADAPSRLVLEGGTHNIYAPPFDFIDRVFLPVINRMGPRVSARLLRHGFYPAGGGKVEVEVEPCASLQRLDLHDRGALLSVGARALITALPGEIAVRELEAVKKVLGWPEEVMRIEQLPERVGPGNIVMLEAVFEHATEHVSGFGKLGVPAAVVGDKAAKRMKGCMAAAAFAGPHLADQLLLPFALAGGGSFTTVKPSLHSRTGGEVISRFLDVKIAFEEREAGGYLVTLR